MAVGTVLLYSRNFNLLNLDDLLTATVKLALVTSSYTPNLASNGHHLWSEVSGNQITTAGGYTTGGDTLGSKLATAITGGYRFESDNPSWTAAGGDIDAWRYGVLYVDGTLWSKTSPLIGYFIGDDTPANIPATTNGNTLTINCPTAGWFDVT